MEARRQVSCCDTRDNAREDAAGAGAAGRARAWVTLGNGGIRRIAGRPGRTQVRCVRGTIWLTEASGGRDVILSPGDQSLCAHRGRILIQALDGPAAAWVTE